LQNIIRSSANFLSYLSSFKVYFDVFVDSFWSDPDQKDNAYNWLKSMFEDPEMRPIWEDSNGKLEYYQNYPSEDYTVL